VCEVHLAVFVEEVAPSIGDRDLGELFKLGGGQWRSSEPSKFPSFADHRRRPHLHVKVRAVSFGKFEEPISELHGDRSTLATECSPDRRCLAMVNGRHRG
jgi:hypothetical protein